MLILVRRTGESIMIGDAVEVKILGVRSGQVKIGVEAPKDVPVHRQEVAERIRDEGEDRLSDDEFEQSGPSRRQRSA